MKYVIANLLALVVLVALSCYLIWGLAEIAVWLKIIATIILVVVCGFIEERFLSKHVNKLVQKIFGEQ